MRRVLAERKFPVDEIRTRWAVELADPDVRTYVIEGVEGAVVGFAATRDSELLHFGTAVETWGSGLAARALDEIVERLACAGVARARLRVYEDNHRARLARDHRRADVATGVGPPPARSGR